MSSIKSVSGNGDNLSNGPKGSSKPVSNNGEKLSNGTGPKSSGSKDAMAASSDNNVGMNVSWKPAIILSIERPEQSRSYRVG